MSDEPRAYSETRKITSRTYEVTEAKLYGIYFWVGTITTAHKTYSITFMNDSWEPLLLDVKTETENVAQAWSKEQCDRLTKRILDKLEGRIK